MTGFPFLALRLIAASEIDTQQVVYELSRLRDISDPRLFIALTLLVMLMLLAIVVTIYRRDTRELSTAMSLLLVGLRCVAYVGLLIFFLGVERRTTQEVVTKGQVVLLVDVSQSMGLSDKDASGIPGSPSRGKQVADALASTQLIHDLRARHNVVIARFDKDVDRLATFPLLTESVNSVLNNTASSETNSSTSPIVGENDLEELNWQELLSPRGTETRIGESLRQEMGEYREGPLAGLVLISDGRENKGIKAQAVALDAKRANIPIYTVGIGATEPPQSIAITDVAAPQRAYPGDLVTITAFLQSFGYSGQVIEVQLQRRDAGSNDSPLETIQRERVVLPHDGELQTVKFMIEPSEVGRFVYEVATSTLAGDTIQQDNRRSVEIDVADRQTRVLMLAGGPARDYRFLRTLLHRDQSMVLDVFLQSASGEISQEANQILDEFPTTRTELYQYDAIIAFDPDWTALNAKQVELLESWIADEAGGLIAVAGPIFIPRWTRSSEHAKLKALYPVEFQSRLTLLDDGHFSSEIAWPIEFTRAGREADFLWLETTSSDSAAAWDEFKGVYGFYSVKGPKLGATVYGNFSDPEVAWGGNQPVFFAGQFYGSGRVFYIGSAETWRLRTADTNYFDSFWTKLIRHVSQGRLLRDSALGTLMVERDRFELGETIPVRARLSDATHEPLTSPSVSAQLLRPDGIVEGFTMTAILDQPGMFAGQVAAMQEGDYEIALSFPEQPQMQLLKRIQVRIPDQERLNPERNEQLLTQVANVSGGIYFAELNTAIYGDSQTNLAANIPDRTETKLLESGPDQEFQRRQMYWLLGVIVGSLLMEWTMRRLIRLA